MRRWPFSQLNIVIEHRDRSEVSTTSDDPKFHVKVRAQNVAEDFVWMSRWISFRRKESRGCICDSCESIQRAAKERRGSSWCRDLFSWEGQSGKLDLQRTFINANWQIYRCLFLLHVLWQRQTTQKFSHHSANRGLHCCFLPYSLFRTWTRSAWTWKHESCSCFPNLTESFVLEWQQIQFHKGLFWGSRFSFLWPQSRPHTKRSGEFRPRPQGTTYAPFSPEY